MNESEAMAVLVAAQAISYGRREHALAGAGSALALLADPHAHARALGPEGVAALRVSLDRADRLLARLDAEGTRLIVRGQPGYPQRLAHTARPPHLLFCRGEADLCDSRPVAVVGTRNADGYGLRHTRKLACALAQAGLCIVSGLALGVDSAAHWGALDACGRTVAVLGGALDRLYPAENRELAARILASGGSVVSEYPPGVSPTRYSFLQRNRIIAGLSLGVLVTQAPFKSGAYSTVQYALEEGREVFALPGDIDRVGSQLPNQLISEGAHPVLCASDVADVLAGLPAPGDAGRKECRRSAGPAQPPERSLPAMRELSPQERLVYDQLLGGELDFDALSERTGVASDELGGVLMMLELDGIVAALPGLLYRLA